MRLPATLAAFLAAGLLLLLPAAAGAAIAYVPCAAGSALQCGTLDVPLDRSGAVPGSVKLAAVRKQAEDLLRVVALAAPVVVIGTAVAHPGETGPVHVHYGLLVALLVTLLMSSAAWQGSSMRHKAKPTSAVRISAR